MNHQDLFSIERDGSASRVLFEPARTGLANEAIWLPPCDQLRTSYKTPFTNWGRSSWVRSKPFRDAPLVGPYDFHSRGNVPYFEHPALARADEAAQRSLLAHRAHRWLDFTVLVEDKIIGPTGKSVAAGVIPPLAMSAARRDGYALLIDEGAHSLFSFDLANQVRSAAAIEPYEQIHRIEAELLMEQASLEDGWQTLGLFAWATAIETMIAGDLGDAARSSDVFPTVAAVLEDHARDEALHSALFRQWFGLCWPSMSGKAKRVFADQLARGIRSYLAIDTAWLAEALRACHVTADPWCVASEISVNPRRDEEARNAASPTIRMLARAGAFEDPGVVAAFQQAKLIADNTRPSAQSAKHAV